MNNKAVIGLTIAILVIAAVQLYFSIDYEEDCAEFGEAKFGKSKFGCAIRIDRGFLFGNQGK
ncbi:MAG: hypothetical protein A3B99_01405 [Candidatus Yanofskybacteria bacterium RIFCSPHIGHO2_02_FULL_44_12b]|uniref:Uncharacterized protein n=1 Tax=Candidatus Wildermuthbacteria bacterium RIFCSPLOWO2_01_FULL_48_16 TaxID=1802461 RepID=A0A1G2RL83_9BACT|nr:MAG: hypothetical protein A3B99_01405 [Candidatus Yanofskybacteria bacterium RIFCSPHIGHO2_02_FULL_44_12b]OHA73577.1 MAG: hypothetical protein A3B24_00090 [Candidatus Wildermuthbacteria bacterium RIFCSPLOWO2_01_FULL_48_16]